MVPKTCCLHTGSPKTGSPSIQIWCFRNKALLTGFHNRAGELRGTDLSAGRPARRRWRGWMTPAWILSILTAAAAMRR
jgi:hypothetical protein